MGRLGAHMNWFRPAFILGLVAIQCVSCVYQDKSPSSPLEYLNGEKYQAKAPAHIGPIPIGPVERVDNDTSISGMASAESSSSLYSQPVRFERVVILKGDQLLAESSTDEHGKFQFLG